MSHGSYGIVMLHRREAGILPSPELKGRMHERIPKDTRNPGHYMADEVHQGDSPG